MTHRQLIKIAKLEIDCWEGGKIKLPRGIVLAILFAFVHRVTTGNTVEESFFSGSGSTADYQI